jgi:threonine dehydrogenase-like Zn-dependent dehydrogenase
MRALVFDGTGLVARDVPRPVPSRDECLVRVRVAGICGTDLQLLDGYAGFRGIPGHEFVGEVVEAGSPELAGLVGRRVVGEINAGCGRCVWCEGGIREHCVDRTVLGIRGRDGAFAEYLVLPAANLHAVPDEVRDRAAVFVEPLAAACRVLEQVDVAGRPVAVLGDGRMGLLSGLVLRSAGARVTIVGHHAAKLDVGRRLGLHAIDAAEVDPARRFPVVVDATGNPSGLRIACALVQPRGTVVLKSTFHGDTAMATWPIVVDEITLVGSRCGPFEAALDLLQRRAIDVEPLIAEVFPLSRAEEAFALSRTALKVLIVPGTHPRA